jgi:hypothetical protein
MHAVYNEPGLKYTTAGYIYDIFVAYTLERHLNNRPLTYTWKIN